MSDNQLNVDFKFNTEETKQQAAEVRKDVKSVNEAASAGNKPLKDREGILERIRRRMAEIKAAAEKTTSFKFIEKANAEIEYFQKELDRLNKIGRQGFDDMGKAIPDFAIPAGKVERLTYEANLYKKAIKEATNTDIIAKYNVKLQNTKDELSRLSNIGKAGFDSMGNAIVKAIEKPIGTIERMKAAMKGYSNMVATSTNPDIISKYNLKLQQTQQEVTRLSNVGKTGFDALGNKILKAEGDTRTFVGALSAGIERLRRLAYIIPGLGLTGLLALAWNPLKKLVLESGLLVKSLNDAQKQAERLGKALDSSDYKKAVTSVSELKINLDLARKGLYDKTAAIKAYNDSVGEVAGKVSTLDGVEQGLIDNADDYIKMTLYKAAANLALEEAATAALEAEKLRLKAAEDVVGFWGKRLSELKVVGSNFMEKFGADKQYDIYDSAMDARKDKEVAKFEKTEKEKLDIATEFQRKAADLASKMGGVLGFDSTAQGKADREMDRAVSAAQTMQQKIYDLKAEYTRKALTKDEEELQSVRDKFIKIAKEAEIFNLNPKNKIKVSVEGLAEVRDQAIADLIFKQDTEKLKISLAEQKKLYQDYEEFKISLGKDKADEKYRDLIDVEKSHLENLRAELEKIPADGSGSEDARKVELEKQIREEESLQLKKFNDLLKANQSYQDQVRIAIETFEAEKKRLMEGGAVDEVAVLTTNHELTLVSLNDSHVKQLDSYKKLYDGIESLSNAQAKKVIENAKEMLANTDMPEALYVKILALIRESEKALNERIYERVGEIGKAFDEMANGVGEMNEGLRNSLSILGDMLHSVSTVGKSIGGIKTGIADYGTNKANAGGGILGTIAGVSAIAGPIGSAVGAVANLAKGIVGVFKAAKESRIQAEKELAAFDAQKYNAEFEINAMYRERLRTQNEINKNSIDGLKETNRLLKEQQKEVDRDADRLFKALQGEQYVAGKKTEKHGGFLGIGKKTKTVDVLNSLAGKSYDDIEKLFISNQLTDRAKELFQQLEKIKNEGVDVDGMLAENTKALWEKVTGTTSSAITDSIIKGFEGGYRTAADFADDFKGMMSNASRAFFRDFVENKEVEAFYKKFAEMADDGVLTEAQRAELKGVYDGMINRINNKYEDLKSITGEDFLGSEDQKGKNKTGTIAGITEATAGRVESEMGGMRLAQLTSNELKRKSIENQSAMFQRSLSVHLKIEENTRNTATNTDRLPNIEKVLVSMEKKMSDVDALRRGAGL